VDAFIPSTFKSIPFGAHPVIKPRKSLRFCKNEQKC